MGVGTARKHSPLLLVAVVLVSAGAFWTINSSISGRMHAVPPGFSRDHGRDSSPVSSLDQLFPHREEGHTTKPFTSSDHVLVTGAAGFIGMHLIQTLLHPVDVGVPHLDASKITAIDDFNSYYSPSLKQARAQELRRDGINVKNYSTCDSERLKELLLSRNVTHIVHLAAQPGVRYAKKRPETYVSRNLICFISILEAIRKYSPTTYFVYASSSSVYGANAVAPFGEDHRAELPVSLYGATKRADELLAHSYFQTYGLQSTGLRFFTVYGSWGRPDMALFSFAHSIFHGLPIRVFDQGRMYRDFTHVSDIVDGIIKVCQYRSPANTQQGVPSFGRHRPDVFNLGNDNPVTVNKLIRTLEDHLGRTAKKKYANSSADEVAFTHADVSKAWRLLKWKPRVSLDTGIGEFIKWFLSEDTLPEYYTEGDFHM